MQTGCKRFLQKRSHEVHVFLKLECPEGFEPSRRFVTELNQVAMLISGNSLFMSLRAAAFILRR